MTAPAVRPYRAADEPALPAIFHAAVHGPATARFYTAVQRAAWSPAPGDPARWHARANDGRATLVAADPADHPLAYADLEADGHIDHLYCHPDHSGTGVASALLAAVERIARERALRRLHTEASEPARRFLLRHGFSQGERRQPAVNGVAMVNWAMSKQLAG